MASSKAEDLKSKVPWYHATLTKIDPNMRRLLEERGVPADEVLDHVLAIVNLPNLSNLLPSTADVLPSARKHGPFIRTHA